MANIYLEKACLIYQDISKIGLFRFLKIWLDNLSATIRVPIVGTGRFLE